MTSFTQSYIIKLLSYSEAVLWFIKSYLYYGSLQVTLGGGGSYPDLSLSPQRIKLKFKINV